MNRKMRAFDILAIASLQLVLTLSSVQAQGKVRYYYQDKKYQKILAIEFILIKNSGTDKNKDGTNIVWGIGTRRPSHIRVSSLSAYRRSKDLR